jgi:hypothetical protein
LRKFIMAVMVDIRQPNAWRIALASTMIGAAMGTPAWGGTVTKIDGTSGSKANSGTLSTTGDLDVQLGFFADYLVVGGGGGGGGYIGGGGGGGAVKTTTGGSAIELSATNYAVTVGAGGTLGTNTSRGSTGGQSSAFGVTAGGGGGGGSYNNGPGNTGDIVNQQTGGSGASGGGGAPFNNILNSTANPGGAGVSGDGFSGGSGRNNGGYRAGGGGGAGGVGGNGDVTGGTVGNGGVGLSSTITGSQLFYGGGGGGGVTTGGTPGTGGSSVGGNGGAGSTNGANGLANRGGGGGGGGFNDPSSSLGGNGGSGAVVVRYEGSSLGGIGGTVTAGSGTAAGYTLHSFTTVGNGNFDMSGVDLSTRLGAVQNGVISGTGNLSFSGPGSLTLNAANTHSGTTRAVAGTLNLGNVNALQNSTLDMNAADSGVVGLALTGQTYNIAGLQGTRGLDLGSNTISVGSNNGSTTYAGVLSGTGGLTKVGTGRLELDGTNTYAGATNVNGGTLAINGNNSAATGAVNVASGAVLEGDGIVGGATTIASGGIHSPGNSPALQTFANGLTYNTGSTFQWELIGNTDTAGDRGIQYDGVDVTNGALTVQSGVTSALVFNAAGSTVSWADSFWGSNQSWRVFNSLGSMSLASSAVFSTLTASNDSGGFSLTSVAGRESSYFNWSQVGSDLYLNYFATTGGAAVPEPSTCVVLAMAGLAMARRRAMRSRRASDATRSEVAGS